MKYAVIFLLHSYTLAYIPEMYSCLTALHLFFPPPCLALHYDLRMVIDWERLEHRLK